MIKTCELRDCENPIGPGAADVGYRNQHGKTRQIRVCADDARLIMLAPRGTFLITPDLRLKLQKKATIINL